LLGTLFDNPLRTNEAGSLPFTLAVPVFLDPAAQKLSVPEHHFWRGLRALGVVLEARRGPETQLTQLTKARWTLGTRQQQIAGNSESNTKSCGKSVKSGEKPPGTASILSDPPLTESVFIGAAG